MADKTVKIFSDYRLLFIARHGRAPEFSMLLLY